MRLSPASRLLLAIVVSFLGWFPACGRAIPEEPEVAVQRLPPEIQHVQNVLLITIDTLRWDALGFAGNPRSETPTLDRLAAAGRVFLDAHAHNVVTLPSHANILTGLYPYQNAIRDNQGFILPESIPTAATILAQAGYRTGAVIGAFPLDSRFGLDRGFELYDDEVPEGSRPTEIVPAERRGDAVVERARRWWQQHADESRFLWVHLYDPHAPYLPAEPFASRFAADPYLGEVAAVDRYLSPLLEPFLMGEEDPTLILLTSDHGEALGDHGESSHGLFAYESTLKVPLVMWGPGIDPSREQRPVGHIDLLPTMLEATGTPTPEGLPGRSLLSRSGTQEERAIYFESLTPTLERGWAPLRGLIHAGHKFVALPIPELYDLEADPEEMSNLFDEDRKRAGLMARELPTESSWPPEQGVVDPETAATLRSLGYLGGRAPGKDRYTEADDPKNLVHVDRMMHDVVDLYQRDQLGRAEEVVQKVVDERPDMGLAYYFWAQILLEQERVEEAISVMSRAQERGVATSSLSRQLGLSLSAVGRADEAVPLLRPLADAGDPDALNALGVILSEAGEQQEARRVLERVFETDPRNPVAHQNLALVALRLEDWTGARDQARLALDLNEGLALTWNYLGTALYNLKSPREALQAWDRALDLEPENLDVLYNVSVVAMEVGDRDRARRALNLFIDIAPPDRYGPDIRRARELLLQLGG